MIWIFIQLPRICTCHCPSNHNFQEFFLQMSFDCKFHYNDWNSIKMLKLMLVSSKVHSGKFPFASIKILSSIIMLKREKSLPRISSSTEKVFSKLILADVYVNEGFNVSHIYDNFQFNYGSPAIHTIFFLLSLVNDWCALRWLLYFHTCSRFY